MNLLPHWVLTDKFPAFYDSESATAIEQTAKVYGAMQDLITEYNAFVDRVNQHITEFNESASKNYDEFKVALRQEFQDFIDTIELKLNKESMTISDLITEQNTNIHTAIKSQDSKIGNAIAYMKDNLKASIGSAINELRDNGGFSEEVSKVFSDITNTVNSLNSRMNTFTTLEDGSTSGDAELMDARTDYLGKTWDNLGSHIRGITEELATHKVTVNDLEEEIRNDVTTLNLEVLAPLERTTSTRWGKNTNNEITKVTQNNAIAHLYEVKGGSTVYTNINVPGYMPGYIADSTGAKEPIVIYSYTASTLKSEEPLEIPLGYDRLHLTSDIYECELKAYPYSKILTEQYLGKSVIPKYFAEHFKEKSAAVNNLIRSMESGDTFIFATDQHMGHNTMSAFPLMRGILRKTGCNKIVFGGDIPINDGTLNECYAQFDLWKECYKDLSPYADILPVRGNHDISTVDNGTHTLVNYNIIYNSIFKPFENDSMTYRKGYYYKDNPVQKIRYIIVDCFETNNGTDYVPYMTQAQLSWLIDKLNVESGWSVIVFGHMPCDSTLPTYSANLLNLFSILKAYKNKSVCESTANNITINHDFSGYNGELIAYISGHTHKDGSNVTDGVLSITTTSDAPYQDDIFERELGTITECAFDIFVVDTTAKTIKAVRVGVGNDREWTY